MIKAILFDFDGTLMDTPPIIVDSWQYTARTLLGHELDMDLVLASFGEPIFVTTDRHFPGIDRNLVLKTYLSYSETHVKDNQIKMYPGMKELVLGLKEQGYLVGMVTTRGWTRTPHNLYDFDLESEFDCLVTGEDCTRHKPDPEPVNIALQRLNVKPEEALMIGDTTFDVECAHNAGVKAAMVAWSASADVFELQTADFVMGKPEDLYDYLEQING